MQVHDPESPGGKVGPGAALGSMAGLEAGPRFDMVSGDAFDADKAYKDSKLCNVLMTREMARRLQERGSPVTANCFGPGAHMAPQSALSCSMCLGVGPGERADRQTDMLPMKMRRLGSCKS